MKKIALLLVFFLSGVSYVNAQAVAVVNANISPKPLGALENNGVGTFSFSLIESTSLDVPADSFGEPNVTIKADLQLIELTDNDISGLTGTLLNYFDVTYNATSDILTFKQKAIIPGEASVDISFPITVTQNSTSGQLSNGVIVNISTLDSNTNAEGNAGDFTYTLSPVVDVIDDSQTTNEDTAVVVDVLSNDNYIPTDGTIVATDPANGTVTIDDNGTPNDPSDDVVTYTPDSGFSGTDTFDYTVCDTANCDTATVTVTVSSIVDVIDDSQTTNEDTAVVVDVLSNDNNIPSDGTIVTTDPANGTVVITDPNNTPNDPSDDVVTYTPDPGFSGTDTFDYTVCDTATPQNCDTATVTVNVIGDPDLGDDPSVSTNEDGLVVVDVVSGANDFPTDGTIVATDPANGTVVITDPNNTPNDPSDDVVTYTPDLGFSGTDTFDYTVCDTATPQNCDTATVTVNVIGDPDLGDDPTVSINEDGPVVVDVVSGANDFPTNGTIAATDPANGTVVITDPNNTPNDPSDDVVTYTPDAGFSGTDTFDYTVCDTATPQNCDTATVTVNVIGDPDLGNDPTVSINEDAPVVVDVVSGANDFPTDGTIVATDPANGTVVITDPNNTPNDPSDDVVTYTPDPGFSGTDTFDYTVCDTATPQNCDTATVTVNVIGDPDLGDDPTVSTNEDGLVVVDVVSGANDFPTDGTIEATDPANGTVVITDPNNTPNDPSDDVVTYTPDSGFIGTDTFDITVCDGATPPNCDTATVTVNVIGDPDLGDDPTVSINEDDPVVVDVVSGANDFPTNGTIAATDPANGTVTIDDNGTPNDPSDDEVTYTPDAGFSGTDTFDITVCDTATPQNCDTATVTVNVIGDPDLGDDPIVSINEDGLVVVDVVSGANDFPTDGTIDVTTDPANGTVVITDPNNTPNDPSDDVITYTPDPGFSGTDTFDYTVCDTATPQNCDTATVTVNVIGDPDLGDDPTVSTNEDGLVVVDVVSGANDFPTDGTIEATDPANGTVVITDPNNTPNDPSDDVVTYTPDSGFIGTDTFDITVCDGATPPNCDTATVTVNVIGDPDLGDDPTVSINEDDPVVVDVVSGANDFPTNGTIAATDPANGTVVITDPNNTPNDPSDDVVTYTPDPGFSGTDTFDYTVCDTATPQNCDTATVTVNVIGDPDLGDDPIVSINEDGLVVVDVVSGANDFPTDGTIDVTTDPTNGTVVITDPNNTPNDPSDDVVTYTPDAGFSGTDTFDITVCDAATPQNCDIATVTVNVIGDPDLGDDPTVSINEDDPVVVDVVSGANDFPTDGTIDVTTGPANGTVVITDPNNTPNDPSDDVVTYTPDPGFSGTDTFDITVCDAATPQNCDTTVVTVVVQPGNLVITDVTVTVPDTGGTGVSNVLDGLTINGNPVDATGVTVTTTVPDPTGAVTVNADGTVDIAPGTPAGTYTAEYQICKILNPTNCETAVVTIVVEATDDTTQPFPVTEGFTPGNGDGKNDVFVIPNLAELYPNFSLEIINRYGNKVYSYKHNGNPADEPIWWDGNSDGRWNVSNDILTVGTYFYAIDFNDSVREPQTGWIYLRR